MKIDRHEETFFLFLNVNVLDSKLREEKVIKGIQGIIKNVAHKEVHISLRLKSEKAVRKGILTNEAFKVNEVRVKESL